MVEKEGDFVDSDDTFPAGREIIPSNFISILLCPQMKIQEMREIITRWNDIFRNEIIIDLFLKDF
ncbi:hypothetical protein [Tatumella sp. UCD-D_suzukii]|uniref:hypothetical protein n=1 Tax=Tatumella sp. UCD-D_suzukii TaxID=1408192 RepID=UPI000472C24A|nr:hypothetical protein [Tatumella sp. UCD-D_suzukii]